MVETLLAPSSIKLFGRAVTDLTVTPNTSTPIGNNAFLKNQLASGTPQFARIYGFSFEGHYYDLPKPAMFLVHGDGVEPDFKAHDRTTVDASGVVAREWELSSSAAGAKDLRIWEYDKGDFSIRLDIETGQLEDILLEATLRGRPAASSGANLASGANLRSGANLASGANLVGSADPRDRR
jgi:hypothetical protein